MLIVKAECLFSPYVVFYCIVSLTVIKFVCEWSEVPKQMRSLLNIRNQL